MEDTKKVWKAWKASTALPQCFQSFYCLPYYYALLIIQKPPAVFHHWHDQGIQGSPGIRVLHPCKQHMAAQT